MICQSSVPCGENDYPHKEHQLCQGCKRRVPVPLDVTAFLNSVSSCSKCNPGAMVFTRMADFKTRDYKDAPSGVGPMAPDWADKPHRLVYDLSHEVDVLKRLLWLRHDPSHFAGLYGDDGEMQCAACGIDFKRMSADHIEALWTAAGIKKWAESQKTAHVPTGMKEVQPGLYVAKTSTSVFAPPTLKCQDCGGDNAEEGFCPFASDVYNRDVPVVLCKGCYHERAMDI